MRPTVCCALRGGRDLFSILSLAFSRSLSLSLSLSLLLSFSGVWVFRGARVFGRLSFGVYMAQGFRDTFLDAVIQAAWVLCLTFRAVWGAREGAVRRYVPRTKIEAAQTVGPEPERWKP